MCTVKLEVNKRTVFHSGSHPKTPPKPPEEYAVAKDISFSGPANTA